ncbi:MAG: hypothetical protein H0U89_08815 [Acidimicrobiia bacterium]|nr:hypothetical protein [Acidimicrobiia bacterium]
MASRRTTYDKLQRDRAKKAKAIAKRERKQEKAEEATTETVDEAATLTALEQEAGELSPAALLEYVEVLHQQFDKGLVSFEEFEEKKTELLGRITVD